MLFAVKIKNVLLLCLSANLIAKYKTKPIYKEYTEIINEDVKWNRTDKNYIE